MPIELKSLPPEEAIAYLKAKGFALSPTYDWRDMAGTEHAAAFTIAKSAGYDILGDVHAALVDALANGTTFADFRKSITPTLQAQGWWGRGPALDPTTGETKEDAQLGSPRRLKTIFDMNMRMAYGAGKWVKAEATKDTNPWGQYCTVEDDHVRPLHEEWDKTVVHMDSEWAQTHATPCGWGCRCTWRFLSDHQLGEEGLKPGSPPPSPMVTYSNARTGEVSQVPVGVDPGFGYNPGKVAVDLHSARLAASKWVSYPPSLAAAASAESAKFMLPALTRSFSEWAKQAIGDRRMIGDRRVVGALNQDVLDFLSNKGLDPASGAITVEDRSLAQFGNARHHQGAPGAVPIDIIRRLPDLAADPEKILWDKASGKLLYVFPSDDEAAKVTMEVAPRQAGATPPFTDGLVNSHLVPAADLDGLAYETVWKK